MLGKAQEYLERCSSTVTYGPTSVDLPPSTCSSAPSASLGSVLGLSSAEESALNDAADIIAEMDNVDINATANEVLSQEDSAPLPMLGVEDIATLDVHHYSKDAMLDMGIDHHMVSQCQGQDVLNNTTVDTPLYVNDLPQSDPPPSAPLFLAVDNSTPLHIINTKQEQDDHIVSKSKSVRAKRTNYAAAIAQLSTTPVDDVTGNDRLQAVLYLGVNVRKHHNITAGLEYIKDQNRLSEENCPILEFCKKNNKDKMTHESKQRNTSSPECIVIDDNNCEAQSSAGRKTLHTKIKIKRKLGSEYEAQIVKAAKPKTDHSQAKHKKAKKSKKH